MTAVQVHDFFKGYVRAFVDNDIDGICARWNFPALLASGGRQVALDREAFHRNAVRLSAFYVAQGLARAEKDVIGFLSLSETTAAVRTRDRLYDRTGTLIVTWEHAYLMSDTPAGIKVAAAMPDGEHRAWRERGTPLLL
ncbi:MAG TPA: hypothetical protein VMI56_07990 [Reyranella sp.]|nr:hypothetical protein [Reyranella sp.]